MLTTDQDGLVGAVPGAAYTRLRAGGLEERPVAHRSSGLPSHQEGERVLQRVRTVYAEVPPCPQHRAFDFVAALAGLALLWPAMLCIAVIVKATSRGPIFYAQRRVGLGGREFQCLKFRSMVADADLRLHRLLAADEVLAQEFQQKFKLCEDPRITPFGRFLRRSSLDELPQLINVLRGEMSIVGPRPIVVAECARYGPAMVSVLGVRPGLTGLWQVSGRNDLSYPERVALDLRYVRSRTLRGDVMICLRTVTHLVDTSANGAY